MAVAADAGACQSGEPDVSRCEAYLRESVDAGDPPSYPSRMGRRQLFTTVLSGLVLTACASAHTETTSSLSPITVNIQAQGMPAGSTPTASTCGEDMASVLGATFRMIHDQKSVTLPSFCMDRTEVTVIAYKACVDAGICTTPGPGNWGKRGKDNHPINSVSWFQASAFCKWNGKRLPSEEEWEYAARGNLPSEYPWGNDPPEGRACFPDAGTCPVGSYPSGDSPFGVKDMSGNVWEWTTSGSPEHRIFRGGPWYGDARSQGVEARITDADSAHGTDTGSGFRCARNAQPGTTTAANANVRRDAPR